MLVFAFSTIFIYVKIDSVSDSGDDKPLAIAMILVLVHWS